LSFYFAVAVISAGDKLKFVGHKNELCESRLSVIKYLPNESKELDQKAGVLGIPFLSGERIVVANNPRLDCDACPLIAMLAR